MRRAASVLLIAGFALLLSVAVFGCASQPVTAQLATACNGLSAAYLTAAGYKAQGKLSADDIKSLTDLEAPALAACDKTKPPTDLATALAAVTAATQKLALINAGVTP